MVSPFLPGSFFTFLVAVAHGAALSTGLTECGGILEEMHGWLPSAGVADGVRKSKLKLKILAVLRAWMAILLLN